MDKLPFIFGLLTLFSGPAFAQQIFPTTQPVESREQSVTIFGNLSETDVTGAPFSAIEESRYSQKQPDGAYLDRTLYTTHIYRDSHCSTFAQSPMLPPIFRAAPANHG